MDFPLTCEVLYARLRATYHQAGTDNFLHCYPPQKPELAFSSESQAFDRFSLMTYSLQPQARAKLFEEIDSYRGLQEPKSVVEKFHTSTPFASFLSILCYLDVPDHLYSARAQLLEILTTYPDYETYFSSHQSQWTSLILDHFDERWPELSSPEWKKVKEALAKNILIKIKKRFTAVEPGTEIATFFDPQLFNPLFEHSLKLIQKHNLGDVAASIVHAEAQCRTNGLWEKAEKKGVRLAQEAPREYASLILRQIRESAPTFKARALPGIKDGLLGEKVLTPDDIRETALLEIKGAHQIAISPDWVLKEYTVSPQPTESSGIALGGFYNSIRFQHEGNASFAVPIHAVGMDSDPYVIIPRKTLLRKNLNTPQIPGLVTKSFLEKCTEEQKLLLALAIVRPLKECHEKDIIHGDVKYGNMIADKQENDEFFFRLLDFDVAISLEDMEALPDSLYPVCGTYIPPEAITPLYRPDFTTDVFAMGCTLYEILTGQELSVPKTPREFLHWRPAIDAETALIPNSLRVIIQKCISPNPQERYRKAHDVFVAIKEAYDETILAQTVSTTDDEEIELTVVDDPTPLKIEELLDLFSNHQSPIPACKAQFNRLQPFLENLLYAGRSINMKGAEPLRRIRGSENGPPVSRQWRKGKRVLKSYTKDYYPSKKANFLYSGLVNTCAASQKLGEDCPKVEAIVFDPSTEEWIVSMEFCEGGDLLKYFRDRTLDNPLLIRTAYIMASLLRNLHEKGFIHRDVKPDNFFLRKDARGLRCVLGDLDGTIPVEEAPLHKGVNFGSLFAPEQIAHKPAPQQAFDLYALGKTLERLSSRLEDNPLRSIISKACHEDPLQRYQTATEFLSSIEALRIENNLSPITSMYLEEFD